MYVLWKFMWYLYWLGYFKYRLYNKKQTWVTVYSVLVTHVACIYYSNNYKLL